MIVDALLALLLFADPPVSRSVLSQAEAQSLVDKISAMERRAKLGKPPPREPVTVSEAELNSYLNLTLGPRLPKGLSELTVRFDRDRLTARGLLDVEELQGRMPAAGNLGGMLGFFSGKVPVEASGRLRAAEDGFAILEIEEVHVATLPVPVRVIEQLVASATRSAENPQGFDIHSPFRFPYAVKRVRLQPGQARLEF